MTPYWFLALVWVSSVEAFFFGSLMSSRLVSPPHLATNRFTPSSAVRTIVSNRGGFSRWATTSDIPSIDDIDEKNTDHHESHHKQKGASGKHPKHNDFATYTTVPLDYWIDLCVKKETSKSYLGSMNMIHGIREKMRDQHKVVMDELKDINQKLDKRSHPVWSFIKSMVGNMLMSLIVLFSVSCLVARHPILFRELWTGLIAFFAVTR